MWIINEILLLFKSFNALLATIKNNILIVTFLYLLLLVLLGVVVLDKTEAQYPIDLASNSS